MSSTCSSPWTSKKKGLSFEEKRTRMIDLLYEKKDFFQLKDLERMAPKEKGITSQSVKEVVQSLVGDTLVDTDKIGTSIYFWAFPSKASQNRKRKMEDLTNKLKEVERKKRDVQSHLAKAKIGKDNTEERSAVLSDLSEAHNTVHKLEAELIKYRESDPEVLEQQKKETATALEAANRWTDNVFSIKSWVKNKFCFEERILDQQFDIPSDFDYIE
ncbi:meiotic nuclear division protein 1 homolog isoform X2 [Babylonia areolata]|uniref:meiotic nuclear division protein 1 homolog isoform X2 n=1 Tax=Babylonia areolata TaxID=304850 RepID=UPI003FD27C27